MNNNGSNDDPRTGYIQAPFVQHLTEGGQASTDAELDAPVAEDQSEIVRMLDQALRPEGGVSVADDLPLLVGPRADSQQRIVKENGRIVAHAALYTHAFRMGQHAWRVGVIGAVATAEDARGRGHGTAVMNDLLELLREQEIPVCVLWSEVTDFYERFGFVNGGRELIHLADEAFSFEARDDLSVRAFEPRDLGHLVDIHGRELGVTVRTAAEWRAWLEIPESDWYVAESGGRVVGYGVVGKGQDLQGCLHEWGGPQELLPLLVTHIRELRGQPEMFSMSPPWKTEAAERMRAAGAEEIPGFLGMIRITDPEAIREQLDPGMFDASLFQDHAALVRALFGHRDTPPDPENPPLPFYLFGLDSM